MPERRLAGRRVAVIMAGAFVGRRPPWWRSSTAAFTRVAPDRGQPAPKRTATHANSSLAELNKALSNNDFRAIPIIQERVTPKPKTPLPAFTENEAGEWIDTLAALRTSYRKMTPAGRVVALTAACRIFDRFAVDPAPRQWAMALKPLHDLLAAGLADADPQPRVTALQGDQPILGLDSWALAHAR